MALNAATWAATSVSKQLQTSSNLGGTLFLHDLFPLCPLGKLLLSLQNQAQTLTSFSILFSIFQVLPGGHMWLLCFYPVTTVSGSPSQRAHQLLKVATAADHCCVRPHTGHSKGNFQVTKNPRVHNGLACQHTRHRLPRTPTAAVS